MAMPNISLSHLWHITKKDNLENILLSKYIIPCASSGFVRVKNRTWDNVVFLTDNPEYIINTQLGSWVTHFNAHMIKLDVYGLNVKQYYYKLTGEKAMHEYIYVGHISSDRFIEVLSLG